MVAEKALAFGQYIKQLRKRSGETVYTLADAIEVSPGFISRMEARGEIPGPATICKLADALGVDGEKLLAIARKARVHRYDTQLSNKHNEALRAYRKQQK